MEYLIVGERFNTPRVPEWKRVTPQEWLKLSLQLRAFNTEGRYDSERLLSLGLDLTHTMNLTPPAPQGIRFDGPFAEAVASYVVESIKKPIVCVGRRVGRAFSMPQGLPYFRWHDDRIVVPHPSGLNRMWNEEIQEMQNACRAAGLVSGAPSPDRDDHGPDSSGSDRGPLAGGDVLQQMGKSDRGLVL